MILWLVQVVRAQQGAFQWGFNSWTSTTLPQCATLDIFVDPNAGTVKPSPPYYIIAYESKGFPTTQGIGSKVGDLNWIVDHAIGSTLILGIVDSNGNSGGILNDTYTISGDSSNASNKSCIPTTHPGTVQAIANASISINTCDSITIQITKGQKPYIVTIAETNTPTSTNVSMGPNDDTFSWVNNLSPGNDNQVILAISDNSGAYTNATSIMKLTGDTNTKCAQQSRSFSSSSSGGSSSGGTSKIPIIVGILVAIGFIGILGLIAWFFLVKRKQDNAEKRFSLDGGTGDGGGGGGGRSFRGGFGPMPSESDLTPYQLPPPEPDSQQYPAPPNQYRTRYPHSINTSMDDRAYSPETTRNSAYSGTDGLGMGLYPSPQSPYTDATPRSSHTFSRSGVQQDPFLSPSTSRLYQDDPSSGLIAPQSQFGGGASSIRSGSGASGFRAVNLDPSSHSGDDEFDTSRYWGSVSSQDSSSRDRKRPSGPGSSTGTSTQVYQHQDAGSAVEEIPPAYPGPGFQRQGPQSEKSR